ncbi:hypothetical protein AS594_35220 [Streptomyces agglomeratus]|uniref:Uncharacterized protein n=1 Tax=Streptomyces agglomeratus TaxID=285458 RepID=A0A1E5PHB3_9ACTN|nr:hypothetical protein AS594_35220 [Streptomyces agglomeratus]
MTDLESALATWETIVSFPRRTPSAGDHDRRTGFWHLLQPRPRPSVRMRDGMEAVAVAAEQARLARAVAAEQARLAS